MPIKRIPDFDKLGNKAYLLVLVLILLIIVIVFKDYFFEKFYCFQDQGGDSVNQYYPFEYITADYIAKYGIPKWSFSFGMGQSLFPFMLRDPFNIFFYYIPGKDYILYCKLYKELAKIIFSGVIFFFYLKTLKFSDYTAIIGSLLFSFCGFMIVAGVWYMYSFEAFNMALLLLAFELLFSKQKWYLFPIAVFLIGISMPFNLYLFGLFLACYAVLRHLQMGPFDFKKLGSLFLKMSGLAIIGLLASGPFFIENTVQLFESPRGNGGFSYVGSLSSMPIFTISDKFQFGTCIMRFFSSDILGSENACHAWGGIFESPEFYCGLPCLLLMPQVFQFLSKRARLVFIVLLTVWLLPVVFPYFRYAFWLFTGNYYREYSFLVVLIFLYYSLQALEFIVQQRKINNFVLITTIVILLALINYPFFDDDIIISGISFFVMAMIIVYGLILYYIPKQKNPAYLKWLFLIAVIVELIYLTGISVNERDAYTFSDLSQRKIYNDYSVDAVNYIKQNDKSFYRIDKTYGSLPDIQPGYNYTLDDALIQGYYGTSCYSSWNEENYINYLELMGIIDKTNEFSTRRPKGLLTNHFLEAESSVKYILTHTITPFYSPIYFDSLTQFGDVKILRNKFALPLGYTYDYFMKESNFNSLAYDQKKFTSIRTCVVKDEDVNKVSDLKEYQGNTTPFNWQEDMKALKKDTFVISRFSQNSIAGTINANEDKMMYLSIPYDDGWKLKVDGLPTDKIILNGGMTGVMLKAGSHTIELNYDLRFFNFGLLMSLLGVLIYFGYWFYARQRPKIVS